MIGDDPIKLEDSRKTVLKRECERFVAYLKTNVEQYDIDPLSNSFAYHITGTEAQALIDLWHLIRQYRVTASKFKVNIKLGFSKGTQISDYKSFWQC